MSSRKLLAGVVAAGAFGLLTVPDVARASAFADFNADNRSDILWRNSSTGENYVYLMNGTTILPGEGYLRTVADQDWQVAGSGDYNGDGRADILWRNSASGENYIYFMNGATIIGEGQVRTVTDQSWRIAGSGDFNGDGRDDILWRNAATGENYVHLMNGASIVGEGYLRPVPDLDWKVVGVGDFNFDGRDDILWRNTATGENYLYPMNGMEILPAESYLRTVADTAWKVVQVGDFDGDGRADILWRNSATGENYAYFMSGTTIAGEGYLRTVPQASWQVQYPSWQAAPPGTALTLGPVDDNTIYEDQTANSNGAGRHFFAGRTAATTNSIRRALLKFDLASSIPAGSTIISATLTLRVVNTGPAPGAHNMTLHRLQADWGEGTSNTGFGNEGQGAPATTNDATWLNRFFPNTLWTAPGGDFVSTPSATTAVGGINDIGDYSWSGAGMTADVRQWLAAPATNFGWLLRGDESTAGSAKQFASKENATAANRPRLVIRYTPP
jgi:FG-GAP-like repeat